MQSIRKRLSFANIMSAAAVFIALGGIAVAAGLPKNSVGKKQLKNNAVTTAKIKKNAVTAAKIKKNAVTSAKIKDNAISTKKIANGAVTGEKVNTATLGTVPVAAKTESVPSDAGTLTLGQEKVIFTHGPVSITARCESVNAGTEIGSRFFISSTTENTVFTSWRDVGSKLGPATPEEDRELNYETWGSSDGEFSGEPPFDTGGSALASNGQAFNFWIAEGAEKDTNTCWYWLTANIIR
jgi:hypothetical protein